jgi:hypothetical protein
VPNVITNDREGFGLTAIHTSRFYQPLAAPTLLTLNTAYVTTSREGNDVLFLQDLGDSYRPSRIRQQTFGLILMVNVYTLVAIGSPAIESFAPKSQ